MPPATLVRRRGEPLYVVRDNAVWPTPCREHGNPMSTAHEVEILLVEDNANDVELTLRALKVRNLANQVFVARDGQERWTSSSATTPTRCGNSASCRR